MTALGDFRLSPADFGFVGHDLARPECIVEQPGGTLWVSDRRGSLTRIDPDGTQVLVGTIGGAPNGFALDRQGRFWIADIEGGRVCRMDAHGRHEVVLDRFEDAPLGSANFVLADGEDTLWISVSTRTVPRSRAVQSPISDGFVLRVDGAGDGPVVARRVARGFHFTNELRIDAARRYLYVAETAIGAVTRLPLRGDGSLGAPEAFGPRPLFPGAHVDGIVFDSHGNLWVTEITRNAIVVLRPDGSAHTVYEDPAGAVLRVPTSITFTGPDRRTALVGSLQADRLASFRSPVPG
jgi:sugar lactone lactonase YvrE